MCVVTWSGHSWNCIQTFCRLAAWLLQCTVSGLTQRLAWSTTIRAKCRRQTHHRWYKYDHVSSAMCNQLHWLRIDERIQYTLCIQSYKLINKTAPQYLSDMCKPVSVIDGRRRLQSAVDSCLCVPRTNTKFGDRAFNVAGPVAWNNLPSNIRASTLLISFKRQLMKFTFLK